MRLRQKLSIREIARLTGLSRNTVTKHLAANTIEPKFATPERPSKIDPFAEQLAGWLKTEAGKSRKERRTAKQLHADLVMPWLHRLLCPGRGVCTSMAHRSAA
jgi:DNA-binding transcriptional ArsR family regulator